MRTKASDADRDRTVSHLEAAFADGQLTSDEREERVGAALSARTLGELAELTADLQHTGIGPLEPRRASPQARRGLLGLAATAAVLLLALLAVRLLVPGRSDTVTATPGITDSAARTWETAPSEPTHPSGHSPTPEPWELSVESLREFREAYRAKFATVEFYKMWIHDASIYVEVPARSSQPRWEGWTWKGRWTQNSTAQKADDELGSLAGVDFRRLLDNITVAERDLGVEEASFSQAYLNTYQGTTQVTISVDNSYEESAALFTAPDGTITDSSPG